MLAYGIARPSLRGNFSLSPRTKWERAPFSGLTEAIMSETFGDLISVHFIDCGHSSRVSSQESSGRRRQMSSYMGMSLFQPRYHGSNLDAEKQFLCRLPLTKYVFL